MNDTRRECIRRLTVMIESGTLRRWECWLLRRIRERLIGEATA